MKFYYCAHCGNIIAYAKETGVKVKCCGEEMKELVPGAKDAALEKHVPVINVNGNTVEVVCGSVLHPMTEEHLIEWIVLVTKQGNQRKLLKAGDAPKTVFALVDGDEAVEAYAYCNLHGLWKAEVK